MRRVTLTFIYHEPQGKEKQVRNDMLEVLTKRHLHIEHQDLQVENLPSVKHRGSEKKVLEERELEDDYPMYPGYLYVADGEVRQHMSEQTTVGQYKQSMQIKSITNCDISSRELWDKII